MKAEHNSHNTFYRLPFGAAECDTTVTLRLSVCECGWPKSVSVVLINGDKETPYGMHFHSVMMESTVYEAFVKLPSSPATMFYYFRIDTDEGTFFYGNNENLTGGIGALCENEPHFYQISVYDRDYKTPDWFKNAVVYQIFPDRFNKSENYESFSKRSDIIKRNWGDTPYYKTEQFGEEYLANDFFGGSLRGIEEKLDYLAELGITCIYLNPIFKAYSNHKYDTGCYEQIDEMFGDEAEFASLCKSAKEKGIRIILDGVFNHTGSDSLYFNKKGTYDSIGAYQSKASPYYGWFCFKDFPGEYDCWWGIKTLPHTNELNEGFLNYILKGENSVIKKWIRLGASGWRLDVVDELPDEFVEILRSELKKVNPDAVIIGEVWEDASNKMAYGVRRKYLSGYELDSAMNYPMRKNLIEYSMQNMSAKDFNSSIYSLCENYPPQAFYAMMNFLSGHDTARILTLLSGADMDISKDEMAAYKIPDDKRELAVRRFKFIYKLLFLLPGAPCIFYGDETGMEGYGDPFCRSCYPWNAQNDGLISFFKSLISIRKSTPALLGGKYETVYGEGAASGFVRCTDDEFILILANSSSEHDWHAPVELGKYNITKLTDIESGNVFSSDTGRFDITADSLSVSMYRGE